MADTNHIPLVLHTFEQRPLTVADPLDVALDAVADRLDELRAAVCRLADLINEGRAR